MPSIRNAFPPAMPRNVTNPMSASLVTAGVSWTEASTRRPLMGKPAIMSLPTTWDTSVFTSSTTGAAPTTSTVCVIAPTASVIFKSTVPPTGTANSALPYGAEPCLLADTLSPSAGTSAGAAKMPPSVVVNSRVRPSEGFATVTFAPPTGAPDESRTVPETAPNPAVACANAPAAHTNSNSGAKNFAFIEKTSQKIVLQLKDPNRTVCEAVLHAIPRVYSSFVTIRLLFRYFLPVNRTLAESLIESGGLEGPQPRYP